MYVFEMGISFSGCISDAEKTEDDTVNASVTEPSSGDESSGRMAYQVQLLGGRYLLLSNDRCSNSADFKIRLSDFDIVAPRIDGVEISASPLTVAMRQKHQAMYKKRITTHTYSRADWSGRGCSSDAADGVALWDV